MTSPQKTLRIFISSPGDVHEERDKARHVIDALQRYYTGVTLQPVLWEDLALPATASFQQTIDFILQKEPIDIAVFILWSRLGSPLGPAITRADGSPYRSGTEREFDVMLEAFAQSKNGRPIILAYTRSDESGFRQSLTSCPANSLEELISQRKLVESFIREQFKDAEGHNVRAYHSYREPVSFARNLHIHLNRTVETLLGEGDAPRWMDEPYRGLEVFDVEHAPIFQGRDEETCDILQRLRDQEQSGCAFTVIVGASGSGKSSLARAGVAAALMQHAYDDHVKAWRIVTLFPSLASGDLNRSLVRALADQLPELRSSPTALDDIASGLAKDTALTIKLSVIPAFTRAAEAARGPVRILLIVDQLEELWTDRRITDTDRKQFLGVLEALARSGQIAVLATLRSDFYPQAQRIPAFLRLKGDRGHCDLLPPGPAALHRLITEPARLAGLRFEQLAQTGRTLDQQILQDASRDPAALPLLQYALSELYQQRDETNRQLTFAAYQNLGGVEGALGKRAADTFHSLDPEVQAALPEILPQLVTIDIDGEQSAVRRRALKTSLTDTPTKKALTEALIGSRARFLTTDRQDDTPIVSLAHEALLRRWDELSKWVTSNREHLRLRARAEQSQQRWSQQNEDPSLLLPSGLPLEEGQILLHHARPLLTTETARYIEYSVEHRKAESRQQRLVRTTALAASLTAALIAIVAACWINSERSAAMTEAANAKTQEEIAKEAKAKAESSAVLLSKQKDYLEAANTKSTALLSEAAQSDRVTARNLWDLGRHRDAFAHWARSFDYVPESTVEIDTILTRTPAVSWNRSLATLSGHKNPVMNAAYSPDGTRIVTASSDNTARLWDSATGQPLATLSGHKNWVVNASFSPDGTRVATASSDNTARLWDTATGQTLVTLTGHEEPVMSATFSPDGTRIVTASKGNATWLWDTVSGKVLNKFNGRVPYVKTPGYDPNDAAMIAVFSLDGLRIVTASEYRTAQLFDVATGKTIATLTGHESFVNNAAFSPDGKWIVTASSDSTARLWDAATGTSLATLIGHKDGVQHAAFSPDGTRIVTASSDNTARLWDAATGQPIAILIEHEDDVRNAVFSPDGTRIVTASSDNTARLWDAATGQLLVTLIGHKDGVQNAVFSPDGTRLLTASSDNDARLWDMATGHSLAKLTGFEFIEECGAFFSPNGTQIVTMSAYDNTAMIWDATTGKAIVTLTHESFVRSAAFNSEGTKIVTASLDKTAKIWDVTTGKLLTTLTGHESGVESAAFSSKGTHIVTTSDDKTAKIWDVSTGKLLTTLIGHDKSVLSAFFSTDGMRIVTASEDNTARLWDVATGQTLATLAGHKNMVVNAAFSPDGTQIVTSSRDNTARLWDVSTGQSLGTLPGRQHVTKGDVFSPDGTLIAVASWDNTTRLWNVATGQTLATLTGHEKRVTSLAFSPDSKRIATASGDKTTRVWNATTGQPLATLIGHENWVMSAAFSPDGTRIVTTSPDKTVRLWDLAGDRSTPPIWFNSFLRCLGQRTHKSSGELANWPSSAEESQELGKLLRISIADQTRYGDIARCFLTQGLEKPTYPGSKVTFGDGADQLIRPAALQSEIERAYSWHPGHPLVQIALAKFEKNTTLAEFLREYGVSRLLKRQPSEKESVESIAKLCQRAEALLLDQQDQPRADRVRQRAEELERMK